MPILSTGSFFSGVSGGVVIPPGDQNDYFINNGATTPIYGVASYPSALYSSALDKTFFAWEAWFNSRRETYVMALDHATGYFSEPEFVWPNSLSNDDHGAPVICLDDENHLHAFYGSHASDQFHSSTRYAWDGTPDGGPKWKTRTTFTSGDFTYPKPFMVGSTMNLLLRETINASTKMPLVRFATTALVAGVATWGSKVTLIDWGSDSRVYAGNGVLIGTDFHIVATKADWLDTIREHVYYFVLDTTTGNIENHDGSVVILAANLPVDLSESNADFRLFTHSGGNEGIIPALAFDTNGDPFVAFADGTGTAFDIKVIKRTSGTWGSPETVDTTDFEHNLVAIGQLPSEEMELFYTLDPGTDWARGGDMMRKVRSAAGVWGSAQMVLAATDFALNVPSIVQNGDSLARVVFTEQKQVFTDPAVGELRVYVWGSDGLIPYINEEAQGFLPTDLPSIYSWYDPSRAHTLIPGTGSGIITMFDHSGQLHSMSAPSAGKEPTFGGTINGVHALTFDGSDDVMFGNLAGGSHFTNTDAPFTIFFVVQATSVAVNDFIIAITDDVSTNQVYAFGYNTTGPVWRVFKRDDANVLKTVNGGTPDTSPHIITVICSGTTATLRVDGVDVAVAGDLNVGAMSVARFCLGARYVATAALDAFGGKLGEVVVCTDDLGSTDVDDCEAYLGAKWVISI